MERLELFGKEKLVHLESALRFLLKRKLGYGFNSNRGSSVYLLVIPYKDWRI